MKIKQFLMAAAALMLAVSCGPDEPEPQPQPDFTPETWSVVGTNNGWDAAGAPAMTFENDYYVAQDVVFEENGAFKFVKDNAWTVSRSYAGEKPIRAGYYYAVQQRDGEGTDIFVETPGKYDIYLNKATDTFYMMADGAVPADAQDGETIEVAPAAVAEIAIRESEMAENYIAFNLTTANVAAASYNVLPTEAVDETITAEVILSEEGGYALEAEDLGTTVETGFRRGVQAGTEYTIFLAYEDLNGVKAMVTETVTTPGAAAGGNVEFVATSCELWNDAEWQLGTFFFYGEDYELVVMLDTEIKANTDYSFADHITDVYFKDANGDQIDAVEAGTFSIYEVEGMHCAFAEVVTASGNTVTAFYEGVIEGLGGGAAGGGEIDFIVAKAYAEPDVNYPDDNSIWYLELESVDGMKMGLSIDTPYNGAPGIMTCLFNLIQFPDPEDPAVYGILQWDSWFEHPDMGMGMFMKMNDPNEYLDIQTMWDGVTPESDMNMIQGRLTAISPLSGKEMCTLKISTNAPVTFYVKNEGGGEEGGDVTVIKKEFTSFGADGLAPYMNEEIGNGHGLALNVFGNSGPDIYFPILDYSQETTPISYISSGFYPVVAADSTESGVIGGLTQYYVALSYTDYYSIDAPGAEADADGRKYGATVTTSMPGEDNTTINLYVPATHMYNSTKVILDITYEGPFGY